MQKDEKITWSDACWEFCEFKILLPCTAFGEARNSPIYNFCNTLAPSNLIGMSSMFDFPYRCLGPASLINMLHLFRRGEFHCINLSEVPNVNSGLLVNIFEQATSLML